MAESSIEWTDATWNPVVGCTILSPGCTNCYAMRMAARLEAMGMAKYAGLTRKSGGRAKWTGTIRADASSLAIPIRWKKPRMVFVNSMSDLFHEDVSVPFIREVWNVMGDTPQHTYQILTKRPARMAVVTRSLPVLPNVWLGTSVECRSFLSRLDELRAVRTYVRFVSFEPLIGSVGIPDLHDIHWAIVGGESGPNARPVKRAWIDEIHEACYTYNTAFFFKQWGGRSKCRAGREIDGETFDEFPSVTSSLANVPLFD